MTTKHRSTSYELPLRCHTDLCRVYSLLLLLYDHRYPPLPDRDPERNPTGLNWEQYQELIYDAGELLWHVLSELNESSASAPEKTVSATH